MRIRWILSTASLTLVGSLAGSAHALQPLDQFVTAAQSQSVDALEARATADQRAEESKAAWAKLGPSLSGRAAYTHNEPYVPPIEVPTGKTDAMGRPVLEKVVVVAQNQLDASITATQPIIDVGSWMRIGAASATADAAALRAGSTGLDLVRGVARNYYQVVAADASIGAARRALAASEQNAKVVRDRLGAGTASELDLQRAQAEVERAKQTLAAAEGSYATSKRALQTQTGIPPQDGAMPSLEDRLAPEAPLDTLEPAVEGLPQVRAAKLDTKAAARNAQAAWAALAPTINATATARATNAPGFATPGSGVFVIQALWNVDASTYFTAKAQDAAKAVAKAREGRAVLAAKDDLFNAWQQVRTQIATAAAAKAGLVASQKAAALVRERYAVGSATQLDVIQADRDVLNGELALIQAYADLAYARTLVKVDSGKVAAPGTAR
jgi:outer membrane protein TolC